jgi:hypothetical protein
VATQAKWGSRVRGNDVVDGRVTTGEKLQRFDTENQYFFKKLYRILQRGNHAASPGEQ